MPLAAWCSRCGMYQWVSADGRCVRGHSAECLSHAHEVPYEGYPTGPAPARQRASEPTTAAETPSVPPLSPDQRRLIALPVAAVALATIAVALFVFNLSTVYPRGLGSPAVVVPPSEAADPSAASSAPSTSAGTTSVAQSKPPRHVVTSKQPDLPSPELDAFIAWQYPEYSVAKRVSFPNQFEQGRLGVNYLLVNKTEPRFRLVVGVADLKATDASQVRRGYVALVGRILTTDEVFSVQAARFGSTLRATGQAALVKALADKNVSPDMAYGDATVSGLIVSAVAETGPQAMDYVMQDSDRGGAYQVKATLPEDPLRGTVDVQITGN